MEDLERKKKRHEFASSRREEKERVTGVLPVKETKGRRVSLARASPMSAPPVTREQTAGEILLLSNTSCMILITAMLVKLVEGDPFLH